MRLAGYRLLSLAIAPSYSDDHLRLKYGLIAYVSAWLAAIAWGTENNVVPKLSMPSFFSSLAARMPPEVVGILIANRSLPSSNGRNVLPME